VKLSYSAYITRCTERANGMHKENETTSINNSMRITLIKELLIGQHSYPVGTTLDYEVDSDRKKALVEQGFAKWHDGKVDPKKEAKPKEEPKPAKPVPATAPAKEDLGPLVNPNDLMSKSGPDLTTTHHAEDSAGVQHLDHL
jgi:hypothetical protein